MEEYGLPFDIGPILRFWLEAAGDMRVTLFQDHLHEEKLQIAMRSGTLHIGLTGRPDGFRPLGYDSYFDYYSAQTHSDCQKASPPSQDEETILLLKQEFILYFTRNLALFHVGRYHRAAQDARHNLHLLGLGSHCFADTAIQLSFLRHQPEVQLLYYRALAMISLEEGQVDEAIRYLRQGLLRLHQLYRQLASQGVSSPRYAGWVLQKMIERLGVHPLPTASPWVERLIRQGLRKEKDRYNFLYD